MDTLGSLCDKLIVVQLKIAHTTDERRAHLAAQAGRLREEIDGFVGAVTRGDVPLAEVCFPAYKVAPPLPEAQGAPIKGIGGLVSALARVNADLWDCVDRQYRIAELSVEEVREVVQRTTRLNLERNACIDAIDQNLFEMLEGGGRCT